MGILTDLLARETKPREGRIDLGGRANFVAPVRTSSGEVVSSGSAMTLPAYFAALRNISEDIGKVPLILYTRVGTEGSKKRAVGHSLYNILRISPSKYTQSMNFREALTHFAMGWGNGYAEIVRDGAGVVRELYIIHPSRVMPIIDDNGNLVYKVGTENGAYVVISAENMFHLRGLGGDGLVGYSVVRMAAQSLGLTIAMQTFGSNYFGNGANPGGFLTYTGKLSEDAQDRLRQEWQQNYTGNKNSNKTAILEEGFKYETIGIPPEESQFLQSRQFQIEDIARWFRISPHKLQDLSRATFSNITHQSMEYVGDSLQPWMVRWHQEIWRKLLSEADRQAGMFAEHLVVALLQGDPIQRAAFYGKLFQMGVLSANDIRRLENMNPIENESADQYFIPGNMSTPEQIAARPAPDDSGNQAVALIGHDSGGYVASFKPMLQAELRRMVCKESKALNRRMTAKSPKGTTAEWANDFYQRHNLQLADNLRPVCIGLASLLFGSQLLAETAIQISADLTAISTKYGDESIEQIMGAEDYQVVIEYWETARAENIINDVVNSVVNRVDGSQKGEKNAVAKTEA